MIPDSWKAAFRSDGAFACLARWLGKRHDDVSPDIAANQDRITALQTVFRQACDEESKIAFAHRSDPYYTSNGHNIGKDEMIAVVYARKLVLVASSAEQRDPRLYAERLVADLDSIKNDYRASEDDPDGYGIGTLHSISAKIAPRVDGLKQ